jgi:hypothetical protein
VTIVAAVNVPLRYLVGAERPQDHVGYSIVFVIVGAAVLFLPRLRASLWRVRNRCVRQALDDQTDVVASVARTLEPIENPFGPKLLPMSPE